MSDSVQVAVRVRPFNDREQGSTCIVAMDSQTTYLTNPEDGKKTPFTFDFSYWSHNKNDANFADNKRVFQDIGLGVLKNAWLGYNASLFAYGQTGSGKSYSMVGYGEDKGIIPLVCDEIYKQINAKTEPSISYRIECTMLEIYNEKVRDLLNPKNNPTGGLEVRENPKTGPYVDGLVPVLATSYSEISRLMDEGSKARTVGETQMNKTSSRAHTLFTLIFTQSTNDAQTKKVTQKVSKITLVDLAGSERLDSTGATGDRAKEGININKSLTELGNCIQSLADRCSGKNPNQFIPYRNSVLTFIMKESLGGNSKTTMIAALSPASINYNETLSTLRYANRAKQIVNKAKVNEDPQEKMIKSLKEEVARLQEQLQKGGGGRSGVDQSAIDKMNEEMERSKALISELQLSNEEKDRRSKEIDKERHDMLQNAGLAVDASFDRKKHCHLINLNEDPAVSENLIYALAKDKVVIGSNKDINAVDIALSGLGVGAHHCTIDIVAGAVPRAFVTPEGTARKTYVNGKDITEKTELHHNDRLAVGASEIFRFVNPLEKAANKDEKRPKVDWQQAVEEMAANIAQEKTKEALNQYQDSQKVHLDLLSLLPKINAANEMGDRINKNVDYQVKVLEGTDSKKTQTIVVTVREESGLWTAAWSTAEFLDRLNRMNERYELERRVAKGEKLELTGDDPFIDQVAAGQVKEKPLQKVDVSVYEQKIAQLQSEKESIMMDFNSANHEIDLLRADIAKKTKEIEKKDKEVSRYLELLDAKDKQLTQSSKSVEVPTETVSGEDPNKVDGTSGESVVMTLITKGDAASVKKLLTDKRLRVHARNVIGNTILHRAAYTGNVEILDAILLVRADVCVDVTNKNGETPLHLAAGKGSLPAVKSLLKAGADINAVNILGDTPLACAVHYGHVEVVQELIQKGADANTKNWQGVDAKARASKSNNEKIAKLLPQ